jgi:class 3 adenylate cyclase
LKATVKNSFRVLVVGESSELAGLARLAAPVGTRPETVSSAVEVAALLGDLTPSVVFVDGDEPSPAGLCVCGALKAHPLTNLVPIVVTSRSAKRRLDAFAAGADDFITPNLKGAALRVRVGALAHAGSARRKLAALQDLAQVQQLEGLRRTFRRYLSPRLADRILADIDLRESLLEQSNIRTHAVVLFADMRGFTNMSERLAPTQVVTLLNEYFSLLTEIAFRHDGTVFSMAGDCLMVGFGVPLPQPDSMVRALAAGREMLVHFNSLAEAWLRRHHVETGLGIGINAGEVVAGNIGSAVYMNYTIIGDAVNIASRLCQRARAGEMLFSASVKQGLDALGLAVGAVALQGVELRGRSNPVEVFCIPGPGRNEGLGEFAVA